MSEEEKKYYMDYCKYDEEPKQVILQLVEETEKLKKHNKELLRKLKNRVKEVNKLEKYSLYKKEFTTLNKRIEQLKCDLYYKQKMIDELTEIEEEHKKENGELHVKLDDKETEIQYLKDDIKELDKQNEQLKNSVAVANELEKKIKEKFIPKFLIEDETVRIKNIQLENRFYTSAEVKLFAITVLDNLLENEKEDKE